MPAQRGDRALEVLGRIIEVRRQTNHARPGVDDDAVLPQPGDGSGGVGDRNRENTREVLDPAPHPRTKRPDLGQPRRQVRQQLDLAGAETSGTDFVYVLEAGPGRVDRRDGRRPALESPRVVRVLEMPGVERKLAAVREPADGGRGERRMELAPDVQVRD